MKRIILNIGDIVVSSEPAAIETVLGSCVSICLWDEQAKIGGMNHYMLPWLTDDLKNPLYYGSESVIRLINNLSEIGGNLYSIKAKIFGGGRVVKALGEGFDIGEKNIRVAKDILMEYNIPIVKEYSGPEFGMKVIFYTATGKVFIKKIQETDN